MASRQLADAAGYTAGSSVLPPPICSNIHLTMLWLPSWKYDTIVTISNIQLCQSMHIYMMKNLAKFHSDPIWNDAALGSFWRVSPNRTTTTTTTTTTKRQVWVPDIKYSADQLLGLIQSWGSRQTETKNVLVYFIVSSDITAALLMQIFLVIEATWTTRLGTELSTTSASINK